MHYNYFVTMLDLFLSICSFAQRINLRANQIGSKNARHLRVYGRRLPALAIVERIVVHKDTALSARYEVTPPRIGARVGGGDGL